MASNWNSGRRRILVIGCVAAGSSAASKAKRVDPDADVRIIQAENVVSYGACGIPYVIEGIINNIEELIDYECLIVATGARAIVPKLKGVNQQGIFFIRSYTDGMRMSVKNNRNKT